MQVLVLEQTERGEEKASADKTSLRARLEALHGVAYDWALACAAYVEVDAQDVLQTTYVKILSGKAEFHGRAALKTWLFAVIRHTAAEQRRRQAFRWRALVRLWQRRPELPETDLREPPVDLDRARRSERVETALSSLSRRQREVLHLVFYQELTIREAAEILGISLGSARVHYDRGKKAMLRQLEGETR